MSRIELNLLEETGHKRLHFELGIVSIGSDSDLCEIVIDSPSVADIHAELRFEAGAVYLRCLSQLQPTFLNGIQLKDARALQPGDQISFASPWPALEVSEVPHEVQSQEHELEDQTFDCMPVVASARSLSDSAFFEQALRELEPRLPQNDGTEAPVASDGLDLHEQDTLLPVCGPPANAPLPELQEDDTFLPGAGAPGTFAIPRKSVETSQTLKIMRSHSVVRGYRPGSGGTEGPLRPHRTELGRGLLLAAGVLLFLSSAVFAMTRLVGP